MIPSISAQTHLAFPEENNSSVKTTDERSTDHILSTEQTSSSLGNLLVVTHSRIPILPAKSEFVVPPTALHYKEQN